METVKQIELIRDKLLSGERLTQLGAISFGCCRLAARIYDLRKKGFDIKKRMVITKTRHFAEYYIEE